MSAMAGPSLVAAALLALAGAQKLLDPSMTAGALRALGLPSSRVLVRAGSAAELTLGAAAVGIGGAVLWALVAATYLAFSAFVLAALRRGTMIGACGCFGRDDTPPHPTHVVLNVGLAAVGAGAAVSIPGSLLDELMARPGQGAVVIPLACVALYLLYAAYVELPRTLAAARAVRGGVSR